MAVDQAFFQISPVFGVAGGPLAHELTALGEVAAFAVGARCSRDKAELLLAVATAAALVPGPCARERRDGAQLTITPIGRLCGPWLLDLVDDGTIELSSDPDTNVRRITLTASGRARVALGRAEVSRLLQRVRREHPIGGL